MHKSLYTLLFALLFTSLSAQQQELNTLLIPNTWQANRLNPSVVPKANYVIGGPGLYNNLRVNNIVYNDLFGTNSQGETILQVDDAIAKLGDQNRILENLDIETISLGARLGNIWVTLGHSLRSNAILNYPKTLPQLIWQGNAQFIGQTISFGPEMNMNSYHEIGLGLVFEVSKGFTLGGRVKYLSGINSIASNRNLLELTTDDEVYQLSMNADYLVNSAGSLQYDGWSELAVAFNFGTLTGDHLFGKNTGTAFDLGATIQLGRLSLSASALDLGAGIEWKDDVHNYRLDGVYEYAGLDLARNILENDDELGSVLDTLEAIYNPVETDTPYTTILPKRYYLNAGYQLNDTWHLGALVYYENGKMGLSEPAFAFGANAQIIAPLNLGATLAYRHEQFTNLGLNLSLQIGPARILVATDNIVTAIRPKESHSANLRLGTSFLFAKKRAADEVGDVDEFFNR